MEPARDRSGLGLLFAGFSTALRDALVGTLGCALLALGVNAWLHPEGLELIAEREYDILVPCPEPGGPVTPLEAGDARIGAADAFLVDARPAAQFAAWHLPRAIRVTYDYLDPTPPEQIAELARAAARSKAQRVVVYGDGDDPDSGEQLAREISAKGIKNVCFVRGGAGALRARAGLPAEAGEGP